MWRERGFWLQLPVEGVKPQEAVEPDHGEDTPLEKQQPLGFRAGVSPLGKKP